MCRIFTVYNQLSFVLFAVALVALGAEELHAQQRGYLMSRACPFSCRTEGINKGHCKDWREGNTCYVEDLRRPANSHPANSHPANSRPVPPVAAIPPAAPRPPAYNPPAGNPGWSPWDSGTNSGGGNYNEVDCRGQGYLGRPRVNVYKSKPTGNIFADKYKIRGAIEGVCLAEAGYFEAGRKRQNIPIVTSRSFKRFEFEVTVRASEQPEIRVYNVNGDVDYVAIDPNNSMSR